MKYEGLDKLNVRGYVGIFTHWKNRYLDQSE